MSNTLAPVTLIPGTAKQVNLVNPGTVQAIKVTNGSPFDITASGFGIQGNEIIPAGTEYRFFSETNSEGTITLLPINNVGVSGTGVANIVQYSVGELLPRGNWPVTVPTQIVQAKVSSVNTLSDEGRAVGSETIDIGDTSFSRLIDIFNDGHGSWAVDQAGIKHQVLLWSSAGSPLVVGQAGDTLPFNGSVTVAQGIQIPNAQSYQSKDSGGTSRNILTENSSNVVVVGAGGGNEIDLVDNAGTKLVTVDGNGLHVPGGGQKIDAGGGAVDLNIGVATGRTLRLQNPLGTDIIQIATALAAVTTRFDFNAPAAQVTNGTVGGSCTFFVPCWGTSLKVCIVQINGWNSAGVALFTFASAISFGWYFSSYGSAQASPTWDLFIGATAQAERQLLTLGAAGAAGTDNGGTAIHSDNIGSFVLTGGGATSMQIGTDVGAVSGVLLIIGV